MISSLPARPADLSTCDQEPIHIPGNIQSHGVLLTTDKEDFIIQQISANADKLFGIDPSTLLGQPAHQLLPVQLVETLRARIADGSLEKNPSYLQTIFIPQGDASHSAHVFAHEMEEFLIIELEFSRLAKPVPFHELYAVVNSFISKLSQAESVDEVNFLTVREVRRITGFDRVLIYRFDTDWNGQVVAEDCEGLPCYLHLWFPASDIPQQARALYTSNRLRLIADADSLPVPILPLTNPKPLNLSYAGLRSVSPIHIEYMKNMGTTASMSMSVIRNGRLWGLISCHNREAKVVPFEVRTVCDSLSQAFSLQLQAAENTASYEHRIGLKSIQAKLLSAMAEETNFLDGLINHPEDLLRFACAEGAAILFEDRCILMGRTPGEDSIRELAKWLAEQGHGDEFHTDALSTLIPHGEGYRERASGLLAISISQLHQSYVLWFRPETIQTVKWGGDPTKPVEEDASSSLRIHPRKSFDIWKEIVKAKSLPWHSNEILNAQELRNAIVGVVLRKAEELAQLSRELQHSNRELEAFSYSVSHDLRAPFRHIVGYSTLLQERVKAQGDQESIRYAQTVIESAQFAGTLVDNLLNLAQIGRAPLNFRTFPMEELVREIAKQVEAEEGVDRHIRWEIGNLPSVHVDLALFRLVWRNLFSNSIKYTRPREATVITVSAEERGSETVFSVKDNGVGFDQRYAEKLFGVFQRLHRIEEFEGIGIGLANVRRIVSRHGGRTWAEGELGVGATIYFSLPNKPVWGYTN
jgi:chemotaxis family two-component system sensor kinase Cph1